MLKKQYIDLLGVNNDFKETELLEAFENYMKKIKNRNISKSEKINCGSELNDALNYLRQYTKKQYFSNEKIFTNQKCNTFGMSYEEVIKCLNKHYDEYDIDYMINSIESKSREKMKYKRYILPLTIASEDLWSFPIDRLISMIILDDKKNTSFASYIMTLSNACNSYRRLDENFSLNDEYINFINSDEKSFLIYLSQKVESKYICNILDEEEYLLRHRFEYESPNFKGSFTQYLESLIDIKNMLEELSLNNEDLSKCYDEYKKMGYNESIYIFLKDFYDIKDYCNNLPSVYLSLKTRYMSIDKEKRMISFKNWVHLKEIEANDNITSDQILENLYYTVKETGFEGQFSEYIKSLCQIKEKKLSLR